MKNKKYNIIAVLDTVEDKLIPQSLELIAFAEIFNSGDLSRVLIIVPGKNINELSGSIQEKYGIDAVSLEHDDLYYPNPELLAGSIAVIAAGHKPEMIVFTHTMRNSHSAAKISINMNASSVTAVESFTDDGENHLFRRSLFNGKFKENVRLNSPLKIITILPGAYTFPENGIYGSSSSSVLRVNPSDGITGYKPVAISSETDPGVKLEEADVIVSAGRGIGKVENLELIRETASMFSNSAIGASRPICDQRWLPFNRQVGITGKTVSPKLYMACGISGSQQHIAGMKNSQCIVAINRDPNASIFSIADYIVIEDIVSFLPVLVKRFRERSGD